MTTSVRTLRDALCLPNEIKRELVIREGSFCNSNYASSLVDTRSMNRASGFVVETPPHSPSSSIARLDYFFRNARFRVSLRNKKKPDLYRAY